MVERETLSEKSARRSRFNGAENCWRSSAKRQSYGKRRWTVCHVGTTGSIFSGFFDDAGRNSLTHQALSEDALIAIGENQEAGTLYSLRSLHGNCRLLRVSGTMRRN
jgi:hypothetical protein